MKLVWPQIGHCHNEPSGVREMTGGDKHRTHVFPRRPRNLRWLNEAVVPMTVFRKYHFLTKSNEGSDHQHPSSKALFAALTSRCKTIDARRGERRRFVIALVLCQSLDIAGGRVQEKNVVFQSFIACAKCYLSTGPRRPIRLLIVVATKTDPTGTGAIRIHHVNVRVTRTRTDKRYLLTIGTPAR